MENLLRHKAFALLKTISLVTALLLLLNSLTGCGIMVYNAKLYDNVEKWLNEDFIANNPVAVVGEKNYPKTRFFIIRSYEEYEEIFNSNSTELKTNFSNQMLILYTFGDSTLSKCYTTDLSVKDDCLYVTYITEVKFFVGDACEPYQRWFALRVDALDISSVVFEKKVPFKF